MIIHRSLTLNKKRKILTRLTNTSNVVNHKYFRKNLLDLIIVMI